MMSRVEDPRHLVLVTSRLGGGGAERILLTLAEHWAGRGHRVTVVTLRRDPVDEYPVPAGVAVQRLPLIGERNPPWDPAQPFRLWALRRGLVRLEPDLVVPFLDKLNVAVLLALTGTRIRVVATEHLAPWMAPVGPVWKPLRRIAYGRALAVVSPTEAITDWFRNRQTGAFVTLASPSRAFPPAPTAPIRRKVVLGVGRLDTQKGFDLLVDAFAQLAPRWPEWSLEIAGEGPDRAELQARAARAPCSSRIRFLGQVDDVAALYHGVEIFALSSRHEAYPMALCEALSAGCAVVAADCPTGPREILGSGLAAQLVPPGDASGLSDALERLIEATTLREQVREAGLRRAAELHPDRVLHAWDAALAGWLGATP